MLNILRTTVLALALASSALAEAQDTGAMPAETAPAESDNAPSDAEERALALFEQAEQSYELGEVDESLRLLLEAQELFDAPVLKFNIARAYETLGRVDEALNAYREYLRAEPQAPDRGAIERRIRALEQQLEERRQLERERAEAEAAAAAAELNEANKGPSPFPWIVGATGLAAAGSGVLFGVLAQGARQDAVDQPRHDLASQDFRRGEDFAVVANVLFVAGGVLLAAGITWLVVDVATRPGAPSAQLHIGPARASLRLSFD